MSGIVDAASRLRERYAPLRFEFAMKRTFHAPVRMPLPTQQTVKLGVLILDRSRFKLSFWPLQGGGWLLYAIGTVTSNLPLRHEKDVVAFRISFLISAFLASFVMYAICRSLWRRVSLFRALVLCMLACSVLGFGCSSFALWSEIHFGGRPGVFSWWTVLSGFTGGAFVLVAWSAIYFGIKQYQALEAEKRLLRASEASAREAQLLALRYQLQPHFLFNTLNAISSLIVGEKPQLATQMISRLAELLRSTLDAPEVHFATLAEELVVVREYLSIEEVRFGPRLNVSFATPPDALAVQIPRFILQPLIENAIRHGIAHLPKGGSIVLTAATNVDKLQLRIENDVASSSERESGHSGLGLANTRERIQQIYGARGLLTVVSNQPRSFVVNLTIPIADSLSGSELLS
jgi:hypothetical protein